MYREICRGSDTGDNAVGPFIDPLALGYLDICERKKPEERDLTEFFGLRDFYRLAYIYNYLKKIKTRQDFLHVC